MTGREPMQPRPMECATVDELAGALALGALEPDEARAVAAHLETNCGQAHAELRELIGAGEMLAASLEPVAPSSSLRGRLMTTVASTAQEAVPAAPSAAPAVTPPAVPTRDAVDRSRPVVTWWQRWLDPRSATFARGLAVVAVAGMLALSVWNVSLRGTLDDRQAALDRVASALSAGGPAFQVTGANGTGYVIDQHGQPILVAALAPTPADHIYEMWLLDAAGKPISVGTFTTGGEIVIAPLRTPLAGYTTFAITVEKSKVDAPTTTPVVVGPISG